MNIFSRIPTTGVILPFCLQKSLKSRILPPLPHFMTFDLVHFLAYFGIFLPPPHFITTPHFMIFLENIHPFLLHRLQLGAQEYQHDGASTNIHRTTGFGQKGESNNEKNIKSSKFSTAVHRGGFLLGH